MGVQQSKTATVNFDPVALSIRRNPSAVRGEPDASTAEGLSQVPCIAS
jgi:hypothetical protein